MNSLIADLREKAFAMCKQIEDEGNQVVKTNELFDNFAKLIIDECLKEISLYSCTNIGEVGKKTYMDGFIEGNSQGYNDAVQQISEGLSKKFKM